MSTLPPGWAEAQDPQGRTYYINQTSNTTTWKRPTSNPSSHRLPQSYPPVSRQAVVRPSLVCTPRLGFWMVAGLSWIVWIFAVAAASDDNWLEFDNDWIPEFAAGSDFWLDFCDDSSEYSYIDEFGVDTFCELYKAFTAMQFIATILCSIAVVLLSVAFFRPATAGGGSVRTLGIIGGILLGLYAAFQLVAFILLVAIGKEELWEYFDSSADEGDTFGVAVVGCFFGIVATTLLFIFLPYSGVGPLYKCVADCMAAGQAMPPPPPPPPAVANAPAPAATTSEAAGPANVTYTSLPSTQDGTPAPDSLAHDPPAEATL